jgi:hypothetical protein
MTVTADSFRENYPAFANAETYTAEQIDYYLSLAVLLLNASRWSTLLDLGTSMFLAHNLVLEAKNKAAADNGAMPGGDVGPVNNKSVDKVSVGYDTAAGIQEGAGHWNLTNYGTRFIQLARMVGAGPIQVGGGGCVDPLSSVNAWPGVTYPFSTS